MMKYSAAIFDMDGTILNTLTDLSASVNAAMRWAGAPEVSEEEVRRHLGNGARKLIERCLPQDMRKDTDTVLNYYRPYYETHAAILTEPYPGIPETLKALRSCGVRIAVVSNKPDGAVKLLSARYFPGVFDIAIGERKGLRTKPSPDLVEVAVQLLHAAPESTVYIGDSEVDILTAANTGIRCISVDWGYRDTDTLIGAGAEAIAHTPSELYNLITGNILPSP